MALVKKGSRTITVGEIDYRWLVSAQDMEGLGLVIELAEKPRQRMVTWFEHGDVISPSVVERCIKFALANDWHPESTGSELHFRHNGAMDGLLSRITPR